MPGEGATGTDWTEIWVDSRACVAVVTKRNVLPPPQSCKSAISRLLPVLACPALLFSDLSYEGRVLIAARHILETSLMLL
jgi:hypothetical protein